VTLTLAEGGLGYTAGTMNDSGKFASVKVFFANSGTEANEGALKIGRRLGNLSSDPSQRKTRIACFENSFHGRSMGALSVTSNPKYQDPFKPLIPDVDVGKLNNFEGLESLVRRDTCAVIVEPIQGEGGIHVASEKWLRALRERCNEVGAVLIFDEVQVGCLFL
jgi:acetylornithine aminotransferase